MHKLDVAARQLYAVKKAEKQLDTQTLSIEEFKRRKEEAEFAFLSTVLAIFNQILRPVTQGGAPKLRSETLRWNRDGQDGF